MSEINPGSDATDPEWVTDHAAQDQAASNTEAAANLQREQAPTPDTDDQDADPEDEVPTKPPQTPTDHNATTDKANNDPDDGKDEAAEREAAAQEQAERDQADQEAAEQAQAEQDRADKEAADREAAEQAQADRETAARAAVAAAHSEAETAADDEGDTGDSDRHQPTSSSDRKPAGTGDPESTHDRHTETDEAAADVGGAGGVGAGDGSGGEGGSDDDDGSSDNEDGEGGEDELARRYAEFEPLVNELETELEGLSDPSEHPDFVAAGQVGPPVLRIGDPEDPSDKRFVVHLVEPNPTADTVAIENIRFNSLQAARGLPADVEQMVAYDPGSLRIISEYAGRPLSEITAEEWDTIANSPTVLRRAFESLVTMESAGVGPDVLGESNYAWDGERITFVDPIADDPEERTIPAYEQAIEYARRDFELVTQELAEKCPDVEIGARLSERAQAIYEETAYVESEADHLASEGSHATVTVEAGGEGVDSDDEEEGERIDLSFLEGVSHDPEDLAMAERAARRGYWQIDDRGLIDYDRASFGSEAQGVSQLIEARIGHDLDNVGMDVLGGSNGGAMQELLDRGIVGTGIFTDSADNRTAETANRSNLILVPGDAIDPATWEAMVQTQRVHAPNGLAVILHRPVGALQHLPPKVYEGAAHQLINMLRPGGMLFSQVPAALPDGSVERAKVFRSIVQRPDVEAVVPSTLSRAMRLTLRLGVALDPRERAVVIYKK